MWFRKSLFSKLLVGILISTIVPIAVSIVILYESTSNSVQDQYIELNQQSMKSSAHYLKRYLDDLDQIALSFYFDSVLMDYLRSGTDDYQKRIYLTNQMYAISKERSEIRAVRYADSLTGEVFANSEIFHIGEEDMLASGSTPDTDPHGWSETHGYEVVQMNGESLLAFHKPIIDYPDTALLGILSIYVGPEGYEEFIRPIAGTASDAKGYEWLLIREDQQVLYASDRTADTALQSILGMDKHDQGDGFRELSTQGIEGVIVYVTDSYKHIPLTLATWIPSSVIHESANQALKQSLVVPIILIAIVGIASFILFYALMAPIKRLVRNVANVKSGNFEMPPIPNRVDELGMLEKRFHSMVRNLDRLMNQEYRTQLELSTARLKMLQAQINPHFLYNTLQSIGTMALRHGVPEVRDKLAELGAIMRYSMDIKSETVQLKKEIEHIEQYLSLQIGRFKNKLSYTLTCPPEAMCIEVPKMILQPLVENSIVHGLERGTGTGTLHIGIERMESSLTIRVMDNGKGIDPDTIHRIELAYGSSSPQVQGEGIGLLNVLERLRLRYGTAFTWNIRSIPYQATVITLRIPIESEHKMGVRPDESVDRG